MTRLDDYLHPLHEGIWEVVIPKETVTEPLDSGWKKSRINVPSPGTIACYRKGRYHVHETGTKWRVHLDRYDPAVNPLLHLIDDAPLLLMISDTFMTLIMETRRSEMRSTADTLSLEKRIWQEQVVSGIILFLVGFSILNNPRIFFFRIFELFIPCAIIGVAAVVIVRAFRPGLVDGQKTQNLVRGVIVLCAGIFAFYLPLDLWILFLLGILALWMIASAVMLLFRVAKGRHAVPEGFFSRMAIGILSLGAAVTLMVSPAGILAILLFVLGAITILLGTTLCINGLRLRRWMSRVPGREDGRESA
ncbi:MAG: hypothetical protein CVV32_06225 [Methanomicrobiales archaeon HGW-Methanomicrobiales-3]|jgi:uncharacterized membrane protein HdeD (DUF308 family)|nr:MAG: hypothetical protein CVV32_06225 [Methanomicrobiales archaeon HGW-Methanomicrobiales-3]